MDTAAKAVLSQIQLGHIRVTGREEQINKLRDELNTIKHHFDRYNEITEEIKELKTENRSDREFVKKSMEFYESATGDVAGIGPLFTDTEEGEKENEKVD